MQELAVDLLARTSLVGHERGEQVPVDGARGLRGGLARAQAQVDLRGVIAGATPDGRKRGVKQTVPGRFQPVSRSLLAQCLGFHGIALERFDRNPWWQGTPRLPRMRGDIETVHPGDDLGVVVTHGMPLTVPFDVYQRQ